MNKDRQAEKIASILEQLRGITHKEWSAIKEFVDMRYSAIESKNAFDNPESVLQNIMNLLS